MKATRRTSMLFTSMVLAFTALLALPSLAFAAEVDQAEAVANAKVDGVVKYYDCLEDAVAKADNNSTVVVLANHEIICDSDVVLSGSIFSQVTLNENKTVTIDLNGKQLTAKPDKNIVLFVARDGGHLILADSVGGGSVSVTAADKVYALIVSYAGGCITINSGSYSLNLATDALVYTQENEKAIINGGNFHLGNVGTLANGSPWVLAAKSQNSQHVQVNGGTFNADILHQFWMFEAQFKDTENKYKALRKNSDGTWTVVDSVLYVDEKYGQYNRHTGYPSLIDALNTIEAIKNDSINLYYSPSSIAIENIYLLEDCHASDTLLINHDLTLNLKDIDAAKSNTIIWEGEGNAPLFTVAAGKTLAIEDFTPLRAGYTFAGWYSDAALNTSYDLAAAGKIEGGENGMSLYAKWIASEYNVFWMNGTEQFGASQQTFDERLALPSGTPAKASDAPCYSYEFAGWFTEAEGGEQVTTETVFKNPADTTYYAQFVRKGSSETSAIGHHFSKDWSYDSKKHWHETTCGHDYIADEAAHDFGDDRICDTCGYKDSVLPDTGDDTGDSKGESKKDELAKTGDAVGMTLAGLIAALVAAGAIALIARKRTA